VDVEDFVEFLLLDGTEYKTSTQLSTGQRCTTVIPMLLTGEGVIIVDQPEDNLDNAFVVGTVVKAILEAKGSTQFILATHNANIPVLANAARVVILNSDGRRVFCRQSDKVEAPAIVRYITGLMEGGLEAFRTRGRFYSDHWSNGD
jgi:ABC-type lipoprotein export system ATPase subunit